MWYKSKLVFRASLILKKSLVKGVLIENPRFIVIKYVGLKLELHRCPRATRYYPRRAFLYISVVYNIHRKVKERIGISA